MSHTLNMSLRNGIQQVTKLTSLLIYYILQRKLSKLESDVMLYCVILKHYQKHFLYPRVRNNDGIL